MKTWHVTYYYLATGMEGRADEKDYGLIDAPTSKAALGFVADREKIAADARTFFIGCLSAIEVEDRLLPCPFCGSKAEWEFDEALDDGTGIAKCTKCRVQTPRTDYDNAATVWNKRTRVRM